MSGWLIPRSIWAAIGPFNESYRWHLDNEWLGHLARKNAARCHLVEKDVPLEGVRLAHERPELATLLRHSLGKVELVGHGISWPLVRRRVHAGSGPAQIRSDPTIKAESRHEFQRLIEEYGRLSCSLKSARLLSVGQIMLDPGLGDRASWRAAGYR